MGHVNQGNERAYKPLIYWVTKAPRMDVVMLMNIEMLSYKSHKIYNTQPVNVNNSFVNPRLDQSSMNLL